MDREDQDMLTGLMRRNPFYKAAREKILTDLAAGSGSRYIPMYLNFTNFKLYNLNHGSDAGNELLQKTARLLEIHFPNSLAARLSADNFVLLVPKEYISQRISAFTNDINAFIQDSSTVPKIGLVYPENVDSDSPMSLSGFFDCAKMAADSIKRNARTTWAVYTKAMGEELEDRGYVLKHFDEALEKGYIKVYYQPVVRTLTGKVASAEALARWEDPRLGLLTPGIFIPVLEESHLITKLDCYIIEETAKLYHKLEESHRPILPVSVNLSRVDIDSMDMVGFMESLIRKYRIPRSYFHIEITETALSESAIHLKNEIDRFRTFGYEVWLDDFGSGYSSLNILQDYHFDTMKIDMAFQKNTNIQSDRILRSIVLMAKSLHIHTLAEGVETKEQADFLRSIGCEKIQGFYYGRPLPYEKAYEHCLATHLEPESPLEALAMDRAGLVNIQTETPICLFMDKGGLATCLIANESFCHTIGLITPSRKWMTDRDIPPEALPGGLPFRAFINKTIARKEEGRTTFLYSGQYIQCCLRILSCVDELYVFRLEIHNISLSSDVRATNRLDIYCRNLLHIYDGLYHYDTEKDALETLESRYFTNSGEKRAAVSLKEYLTSITPFIHPHDRSRFLAFMDPKALCRRPEVDWSKPITAFFRLRTGKGDYHWRELDAVPVHGERGTNFLFCFKDAPLSAMTDQRTLSAHEAHPSTHFQTANETNGYGDVLILDALRNSEELKFFWKDKNRRFLGASRAFLTYYGLSNESEIIGKTDEDMGWHVDDSPFRDTERKVLDEGYYSHGEDGACIIKGKLHHIRASKYPVYQGNRVVGLLGYFTDLDSDRDNLTQDGSLGLVDAETGLQSYRSMLMTSLAYESNYRATGEDYLVIILHIPAIREMGDRYGETIRIRLLHRVSSVISRFCSTRSTLSYLGNSRFLVFYKVKKGGDQRSVQATLGQLEEALLTIHDIDGCSVTLHMQYAMVYGSEATTADELLTILNERLNQKEKGDYGHSIYVGDRIAFDLEIFDHVSSRVIISDMDTNELLYMNEAAMRDTGCRSKEDYVGRTCFQVCCGTDKLPQNCPRRRLRRGHFLTEIRANSRTRKTYLIRHALIPWRGRNCHFEIATSLAELKKMIHKSSQ